MSDTTGADSTTKAGLIILLHATKNSFPLSIVNTNHKFWVSFFCFNEYLTASGYCAIGKIQFADEEITDCISFIITRLYIPFANL